MKVAIGVRRAIVKDKIVIGGPVFLLPLVEIVSTSLDILIPDSRERSRANLK